MSHVHDVLMQRLAIPTAPRCLPAPSKEFALKDGKLLYERWTIPGRRGAIPAWFLIPEQVPAAAPTLLALHPHGRQFEIGKSWVAGLVGDPSRAYGRAAAQRGFAVLAPDLPGFEDHRPDLMQRKGNYALQAEAYERLLANQAAVQGETLQGHIIDDLLHCVDALQADSRVAAQRIGAIGQSYGGQEVIFAMLADERIGAGVVSCGFSLVSELIVRNISHNMALYVPGLLPHCDFDSLVPAIAPRALRVIAGRQDPIYPVAGVEAVEKKAAAAWLRRGAAERLRFRYFEGAHDLPADELDLALSWLEEVLA